MATNIPLSEIKYLSFEGGGGKGIVYLGTLEALEGKFGKKGNPLIDVSKTTLYNVQPEVKKQRIRMRNEKLFGNSSRTRAILGVSGSSAGAITAFMVAMGMTKNQIENVFSRTTKSRLYPFISAGLGPKIPVQRAIKTEDISYFEQLLDDDYSESYTRIWQRKDDEHNQLATITYKSYNKLLPLLYLQSQPLIGIPNLFGSTYLARKLSDGNWGKHLYGLIHERGIFSGIKSRKIFGDIMKEYLLKPLGSNQDALTVTFGDFFLYTGIDLVVTGSNISTGKPMLFSVFHTRDFPVVEAIAISMNLPAVFRPVYIDSIVHNDKTPIYNEMYRGFYADGGITNNLPFRVFNQLDVVHIRGAEEPTTPSEPENDTYHMWVSSYDYKNVHEKYAEKYWTLSFDLVDNSYKPFQKNEIFEGDQNNFLGLFSDLYQTVMFSTSEGQFRTDRERERRVPVEATGLKVADFATAKLNKDRKDKTNYDFFNPRTGKMENTGDLDLGGLKEDMITLAKETLEKQYKFE